MTMRSLNWRCWNQYWTIWENNCTHCRGRLSLVESAQRIRSAEIGLTINYIRINSCKFIHWIRGLHVLETISSCTSAISITISHHAATQASFRAWSTRLHAHSVASFNCRGFDDRRHGDQGDHQKHKDCSWSVHGVLCVCVSSECFATATLY